MGVRLDPDVLRSVASAAAQVLGPDHALVHKIAALAHDPDRAHEVWSDIEALPELPRRALAAIVAEHLMPGLTPPSSHRH